MNPIVCAHSIRGVIVCAILAAAAGCGDSSKKLIRVTGNVTLDGQAIPSGVITFQPTGENAESRRAAVGVIRGGMFDLSTFDAADGAAPGDYLVGVDAREAPLDPGAAQKTSTPAHLERLASPGTSGLVAKVPADEASVELNFTLDSQ